MNSLQAVKQLSCISLYNDLTSSSYKGHGNVKCINPSHEDNNASMQLTDKSFKCFACNTGGSVVDLYAFSKSINLQHNKSMLFKLSDELCDKYNLKYDKVEKKVDKELDEYLSILDTIVRIAKYYMNTTASNKVISYLNNRGFDNSFITSAEFGYIPNEFKDGDKMHKPFEFIKSKISLDKLIQYGLSTDTYLTFANRIIIPIYDEYGRVISITGRSNGVDPKYLLMKTNKYWEKHKQIYNWHQAAGYKQLIVVEGFMDALSFLQAGINNVISLMGLSLSEEHYKKLNKKELILALDNDKAGHDAMYNTIVKYDKLNLWIPKWYLPRKHEQKFADLSNYKDANDLYNKDKSYLKSFVVNNCITKYEYVIRYYKEYKDISAPYVRKELRDILVSMLRNQDKTTVDYVKTLFNRILGIGRN